MVVIMAFGPCTPRSGRSASRSMRTPRKPQADIVTTRVTSRTPTSGAPCIMTDCPSSPNRLSHAHRDEGADHEDVEMGEVDQLEDAVDDRKTERQQRIHRPETQSVDQLLKENVEGRHGVPIPALRRTATGAKTRTGVVFGVSRFTRLPKGGPKPDERCGETDGGRSTGRKRPPFVSGSSSAEPRRCI